MERVNRFIVKNKGYIKIALVGGLGVFLMISVSLNGCSRKRAERLSREIARVVAENSVMRTVIDGLHLEIEEKEYLQDSLKLVALGQEKELGRLQRAYNGVYKELENMKEGVSKIPAEESYRILITEAYPFTGEMKFPFNEPQVKTIHLNWIENRGLRELNENLAEQISNSALLVGNLKELNRVCEDKYDLLSKSEIHYKNLLDNTEKALLLTEKELTKIRRSNKALYYGVGGSALGGLLLGLLIFN